MRKWIDERGDYAVCAFLLLALAALVVVSGCASIDSRLRAEIAETGSNFETYAEASAPADGLTEADKLARLRLEAKLREFFRKAREVK